MGAQGFMDLLKKNPGLHCFGSRLLELNHLSTFPLTLHLAAISIENYSVFGISLFVLSSQSRSVGLCLHENTGGCCQLQNDIPSLETLRLLYHNL